MRIAITGRHGQVAKCLRERGPIAGHEIIALGRPELDLADPQTVLDAVAAARPDVVVSAAAYTAVDKAESEPDVAHAINARGAGAVAAAAAHLSVPTIHLSTDYVFDGRLDRPYVESDLARPTGVYGASKLAGEQAVLAACPHNAVVLRVAWVYSPFGSNFVKTMLRLAGDRHEIAVVADQLGNPTSALDIADGILAVAGNLNESADPRLRGIFHMTAQGEANWADFAAAIFAVSSARGNVQAQVRPITTSQYPTPAMRPANSRLDCRHIAAIHGVRLPHWDKALDVVLDRLLAP